MEHELDGDALANRLFGGRASVSSCIAEMELASMTIEDYCEEAVRESNALGIIRFDAEDLEAAARSLEGWIRRGDA